MAKRNTTKTVIITIGAVILVLMLLFPNAFKDTASGITQNITLDIRGQIEASIEEKVPQCFELTEDFGLSTTQTQIDDVLTECLDIICTFNFDAAIVQFFAEQNKQECIDRVTEAYNDEIQRLLGVI